MIFYQQHRRDFEIFTTGKTFVFPSHMHRQIEMLVCFAGEIEVTCDFQMYTLTKGDWLIVPPDCEHSYVQSVGFQGIMLIFNPTLVRQISRCWNKRLEKPVVHSNDRLLYDCVQRLLECKNAACNETLTKGYLYVIMGTLLEKCTFVERRPEEKEAVIPKLLDYLSRHFTEELDIKSLAGQFGISHYYLSHVFRGKLGCSFPHYLHMLRVDYAKYLLSNTDMPITEIVYLSGFSTQRTFNRVFLELEGCTPGQYRMEK